MYFFGIISLIIPKKISMQGLRIKLEKLIIISDTEWAYILTKFKKKSAQKGDIVNHIGDIFSEVWYIKSGLGRSYFIDNNIKDFTWKLYFNDENMNIINLLMDDSVSYNEQTGSLVSFDILSDAEFFIISI